MATHDTTTIGNILDVLKFKAPDGSAINDVVNTLVEIDHFSADMPSLPANAGLTHQGLRTIQLPTGELVDVGGFWGTSKAEFEPFVEGLCTIRSTYKAPRDTYKYESKEVGQAQLQAQIDAHFMGLNQHTTNLMLEGSTAPTQSAIIGLMERAPYNAITDGFTWDVGGTGTDLRSAWLMKPGIETVHALHNGNHPTMGIEMEDMGAQLEEGLGTSSDKHRWNIFIEFAIVKGICIKDQTAVKRLANIPVGSTDYPGEDVVRMAIDATIVNATKLPGTGQRLGTAEPDILNTWMLYCDEKTYSKLVQAGNDKTFVYTSADNIYRMDLPMIGPRIVVRRMDALNKVSGSGETQVT